VTANDAEAPSAAAAALPAQAAHQQCIDEAMQRNLAAITIDDNAAPFDPIYEAISSYRDHLVGPQYGTEVFTRRALEFKWVRPDYLLRPGILEALEERYAALDLR